MNNFHFNLVRSNLPEFMCHYYIKVKATSSGHTHTTRALSPLPSQPQPTLSSRHNVQMLPLHNFHNLSTPSMAAPQLHFPQDLDSTSQSKNLSSITSAANHLLSSIPLLLFKYWVFLPCTSTFFSLQPIFFEISKLPLTVLDGSEISVL